MMFIENWISPRSMLTSVFSSTDISNIRIKIANDLVFQPKNSGMKQRVIEFKQQVFSYIHVLLMIPLFICINIFSAIYKFSYTCFYFLFQDL